MRYLLHYRFDINYYSVNYPFNKKKQIICSRVSHLFEEKNIFLLIGDSKKRVQNRC